jgi:hypothetical protein
VGDGVAATTGAGAVAQIASLKFLNFFGTLIEVVSEATVADVSEGNVSLFISTVDIDVDVDVDVVVGIGLKQLILSSIFLKMFVCTFVVAVVFV